MKELISLISEADGFLSMSGAKLSDVETAESLLGLHLAQDYKEYVLAFGAATFNGHELTGICRSDRLNVVSATERARLLYPCFPGNLYVIEDLQFDHVLTVQDSTGTVSCYGPDDEPKYLAESLREYLFPGGIETDSENKE